MTNQTTSGTLGRTAVPSTISTPSTPTAKNNNNNIFGTNAEKPPKQRMSLPEFISVQMHPESGGNTEGPHLVQTVPGRKLAECLEPYLTLNGLCAEHVEYFLEKSSTPIPENSDSRFLAGHKIFVKCKFRVIYL